MHSRLASAAMPTEDMAITAEGENLDTTWRIRRKKAAALCDALIQRDEFERDALRELATDPKWEVRHDIAASLAAVPDEEIAWFQDRLLADGNSFVVDAAKRALQQREQRGRIVLRRQQDACRFERQMALLESQLGRAATKAVVHLSDERVGQIVGAMAHDLRGVLTSLRHACHGILADACTPRQGQRVRNQLALMENMIADMSSYTQTASLERRPERLCDLAREAADAAREIVLKSGIDPSRTAVRVEVHEALRIPVVRHLLLMALVNVLKNAHEALSETGGEITIRATVDNHFVTMIISDNGPGIAPADTLELMKFQPGRRNKAKTHSTGFGLPIAARNIAAHGGALVLSSEEGIGTTVTLTLALMSPLEEKIDAINHQSARSRRRSHDRGGRRGHVGIAGS